MAKKITLLTANVVLVTENVNPSMFNTAWFVKKEIFSLEEINSDSIFVPGFTLLSSSECQIAIVPDQIQVTMMKVDNAEQCINNRIKRLFECTNPYCKALGINFVWKISDKETDICQFTHSIFGKEAEGIYSYFNKADSKLGAYFSQNYDDNIRLKLDMKPVEIQVEKSTETENAILSSFNYHYIINQENDDIKTVSHQLDKWKDLYEDSNRILCLI